MAETLEPDPSVIGGVPEAPFVFLPDPVAVFQSRARRFGFLARSSRLGPYLAFLGDLSALQARLAVTLPSPAPLPPGRGGGMPVIDRALLLDDPALHDTLAALCKGAAGLDMPEPARLALEAVSQVGAEDRRWLLGNILTDTIPEDGAAAHLFAAAAVQVHLARLAERLAPEALAPVGTGTCPACGGLPVSSTVMATPGIENVRYAACSGCATQWNEVRVKCLCCGSTKGIGYRSAETHEASVKAETCAECGSWLKIFHRTKNHSLDPVADDVGSLGLDLMMRDTGLRRGGFHPFLAGY